VAVAVLIERDGKVLLVRRANTPQKGMWTLPAGFVDAGEDPAQAAERECLEETGLKRTSQGWWMCSTGRSTRAAPTS